MNKPLAASVGSYFLAFAVGSSSCALYDNIQTRAVFATIGTPGPSFWELFWAYLPESLGAGAEIALVTTVLFALVSWLYWRRSPISSAHASLSGGSIAAVNSFVTTFGLIIAGRAVKGPPGIIAEVLNSFSGMLVFLIVATILFSYIGFAITWFLIKRTSIHPTQVR